MLQWLELSKALFVLDRGFFSSYNLKRMNERMRFVIPFSRTETTRSCLQQQGGGGELLLGELQRVEEHLPGHPQRAEASLMLA
jgi:transposase